MWSLDVLRAAGCAPVVVVVPDAGLNRAHELTEALPFVDVARGGDTRRASVAAGLRRVRSGRVVVHDAARPLVTRAAVEAVVDALGDADGALVAAPVDETLKRVEEGRVRETVARDALWRAQTPQAFRTAVLREAHERAARDGLEATDDAQLVERCGGDVRVVAWRATNLKITYPEDFVIAQAMLEGRS
jgi:2-C-methyl-D-erythritol 4-phosphate cytidylyltransferase